MIRLFITPASAARCFVASDGELPWNVMSKTRLTLLSLSLAATLLCALCCADDSRGIRLRAESTSHWRFGVVVKATGAMTGIVATLPVPMDWPEQTVKKVSEQRSPPGVTIDERVLDG